MQGNFLVFAHASPRACPRRIVRFTTQSERTRQFQATTRSARAISRQNPADFVRNTFELRPIHTANGPQDSGAFERLAVARDGGIRTAQPGVGFLVNL
jgi:hypothetical protein